NNANLFGTQNGNVSVTLSGGTLAVNADAALVAAGQALKLDANSATAGGLEFLTGSATIARPVTLASTTRVVSNGTDSNTIAGTITGAGQLVKGGTGTLMLSGTGSTFPSLQVREGAAGLNGGSLALTSPDFAIASVALAVGGSTA